jgi:hypothetical protein
VETHQVTDQIIVQYVGFTAGVMAREYSFLVRDDSGQPREYTVTIANEAFVSHRVRYQDGPMICSLRLRRELAANATDPNATDPYTLQFCITDSELADYKNSSPKPVTYLQKSQQH